MNPNLPAWRVRDIIEQSTIKVGSNAYETVTTRLNGTWNQYVGYGMVDAYAAAAAVNGQVPSAPTVYTELTEISQSDLSMMGLDYDVWDIAYVASGAGEVIGFIDNYDSSATYIWTSTLPPYSGTGSTFTVEYSSESEPVLHEITCKVIKNGYSVTSGISIAVIPHDYIY